MNPFCDLWGNNIPEAYGRFVVTIGYFKDVIKGIFHGVTLFCLIFVLKNPCVGTTECSVILAEDNSHARIKHLHNRFLCVPYFPSQSPLGRLSQCYLCSTVMTVL